MVCVSCTNEEEEVEEEVEEEGGKVAALVGLNTTNPAVAFISVEFPFISPTLPIISALVDTTAAAAAAAAEKEEVDNDDGILDLHFNSSVTVF